MRRRLRSSGGFTYVAALLMVVVVGLMASRGAIVWKTVMQREKETELLSRGTQIRDAMRRWYKFTQGPDGKWAPPPPTVTPQPTNLPDLEALTVNPSSPGGTPRYLRPYALEDPMSTEEDRKWVIIRDGSQKIIGVRSASEREPLKKGNFPLDLHPADFEKKKKYSEWWFVYNRVPEKVTASTNDPNKPAPLKTD